MVSSMPAAAYPSCQVARTEGDVTLEDLGNVGEFVAAIATLITLIYLAVQIRQNTGSVKAAAAQSVLAALNEALQSAASTPQLARVVVLGQADYNQ